MIWLIKCTGRVTHIFKLIDRPCEESQLLLHGLCEVTELVTLGTVVGVLAKLLSKQLLLQGLYSSKYYINMRVMVLVILTQALQPKSWTARHSNTHIMLLLQDGRQYGEGVLVRQLSEITGKIRLFGLERGRRLRGDLLWMIPIANNE